MAMMMAMSMVMSWYDTTDDWSKREALLLCGLCWTRRAVRPAAPPCVSKKMRNSNENEGLARSLECRNDFCFSVSSDFGGKKNAGVRLLKRSNIRN